MDCRGVLQKKSVLQAPLVLAITSAQFQMSHHESKEYQENTTCNFQNLPRVAASLCFN